MEEVTKDNIRKWVHEATQECFTRWAATQLCEEKERLTKEEALAFLHKRGYETTISKLHKLTASGEIHADKINGKLSFLRVDLLEWVKCQIDHDVSLSRAAALLAKSAQRKGRSNSLNTV